MVTIRGGATQVPVTGLYRISHLASRQAMRWGELAPRPTILWRTDDGPPRIGVMVASDPREYPRELVRDVTLSDGTRVHLRPIRPEDAERLIDLHSRLSRHTAYQRFFTVLKRLPPDWARMLADVDYQRRLALVAEIEAPRGVELIGVGRWEPTDRDDTVEVAFVVQDGWQGKGLGTILLLDLLGAAEARGLRRFVAFVLADNSRMIGLLARCTDVQSRRIDSGIVEIVFVPRRTGRAGRG